MNTKNLKKTYFHTYESFFIENNFVVSAPFVMNRSWDVLNNYHWVSIKQQVPLRLYMWYTKTNSWTITINKISYLELNWYNFVTMGAIEYASYFNNLNKFLQEKYGYLCEKYGGIEINILSELPRGVGLWFWSILALVLSLLINRLEENITNISLIKLTQRNINELLNDQYSPFYKIFLDALEFDKYIYWMISSWTKLASFFNSYYPIISFSEDNDKSIEELSIKKRRYFWFKLNDLYPELREISYLPMDYGITYSGTPVLLEQVAGSNYKNNWMIAQEIISEMKGLFGDFLQYIPINQRPKFYKNLIEPEKDEINNTYGKIMGIASLKILFFMSKVCCNGYDENNVIALLDSLKKLRQSDCVTRDSADSMLLYIKRILEKFEWSSKKLALLANDSTIMWWSLLFVMPLEVSRNIITNAIDSLNQEFEWSRTIYTSWWDGLSFEWCKIEQDLVNNKYSEFLDWRNCIMKRTNGKVVVWDCDKLVQNQKKWLLLDSLNNKIYLDWQKLTSQDLHSQTATIEIVKMLLENPGRDISNKQLPPSSYSKNKNDMLWKIVWPLLSLVEEKTGKKLPLICKGSLYEFTIKLNNSDIEMTILNALS